ncbi:MAG: molecular chaperone DnaJ [Methanomicrobiales archaeon]|nr:molecular chaperone DnaJ [Methanomicrobiales archaeon]
MTPGDYYQVLGVPRSAGEKEIRKAYRTLARKYHPDVCKDPGAEERFKEINQAYSVLSDPDRKAQYDRMGHDTYTSASRGSYTGGGFGGGPFGGFQADFSGFGDIFDTFFGGGPFGGFQRTAQGPRSGSDLLMRLQVPLEDAVAGTDREIEVSHSEPCPACKGSGSETGKVVNCAKCGGTGQFRQMTSTAFGQFVRMSTCPECSGRGRVPEKQCPSCRGSGHTRTKRKIRVHIPAGIETGMRLRMEGFGEAGEYGAPSGDLFVEVAVLPHDRFIRDGDDLETAIHISPAQAVIGSAVDVETIDHRHIDVHVPPGTQQNAVIRVQGEGVKRKGRHGDLRVRVKIAVPKHLTDEERGLYHRLLELEGKKAPESGGFFGDFMGKKRKKKDR